MDPRWQGEWTGSTFPPMQRHSRGLAFTAGLLLAAPSLGAQTAVSDTGPGDRLPAFQSRPVQYTPQGLEGQDGFVLLQFVVDTGGRVDTATIQIVRATDGRFIEAARLMAGESSYESGIEGGSPARVMIQQMYRFNAGTAKCARVITPHRRPLCADSVAAPEGGDGGAPPRPEDPRQ